MFNQPDTTSIVATDAVHATDEPNAIPGAAEVARPADEPAPRLSQRWQCPDCDNGITLHVRVKHAPICNNKLVHSRRYIDMKKQPKGNPQ